MKKTWPLLTVILLSGCSTSALLGGPTSKTTDSVPPEDRCAEVLTE